MSIIRTPIRMRLPIPDRDKADLGLPVCTLDVNQGSTLYSLDLRGGFLEPLVTFFKTLPSDTSPTYATFKLGSPVPADISSCL